MSFDVYFRDVLQCIKSLYGDPEFAPYLIFAPEKHYLDEEGGTRLYHDLHTGRWWWATQVRCKSMWCSLFIYMIKYRKKSRNTIPVPLSYRSLSQLIKLSSLCSATSLPTQSTSPLGICRKISGGNPLATGKSYLDIYRRQNSSTSETQTSAVGRSQISITHACARF